MRRFKPWKGGNYNEGLRDGRRVLIVGESHYEADGSAEFTRTTIQGLGIEKPYRFFEAIRQTACGLNDAPEPADFWHRVAFANAVQEDMPDKTVRPTGEQMKAGMVEMKRTVSELKPDLLLCYSAFAWHQIHALDWQECVPIHWPAAPKGDAMRWTNQPTGAPLLAVRINHPARMLVSRQVWSVWIEAAWTVLGGRGR